ncbi:hypothetical protein COCNU_scaffold004299G000020 [Cocos nucifera]|nr:hypothetical protein [Cocos nucifera]
MDISVGPEEMNLTLLKMPELNTHWKRKVKLVGNRAIHAKVEHFPTPSIRSEEPESQATDDFRIVRVPPDSGSSAFEEDRRKQMDRVFSELIHYINGYMEQSIEHSAEALKHKTNTEMLKGMRDKTIKEAEKAFTRADATKKITEDTEIALRGAVEENSRLLAAQVSQAIEINELKARLWKVEELEVEAKKITTALRVAKEKMAKI